MKGKVREAFLSTPPLEAAVSSGLPEGDASVQGKGGHPKLYKLSRLE